MVGGRLFGYLQENTVELNSGLPRTNSTGGRVDSLNPGPLDHKSRKNITVALKSAHSL